MPRKCTVCLMPHVAEYDRMYLEDKRDVEYIWRRSMEENPGGHVPGYQSFLRHYRKCVDQDILLRKTLEKEKSVLYQKVVKGSMQVGDQLLQNLQRCNDKIEKLLDMDEMTPADEGLMLKYMGETRMTIQQIFTWREQFDLNTKEDESPLIDRIKEVLKKTVPSEYLILFAEEWAKVEQDPNGTKTKSK